MTELRSYLFNIEPEGKNTSYIESSTSYLNRLANKHTVFVGSIVKNILTKEMDKDYLRNIAIRGGDGFYKSSNALNGVGLMAKDFVDVLQRLTTRNDLQRTTLLSFSEVLPTRGLLRTKKAWCPECFEEMKPKELYEPLLWTFKVVEVCPRHNTKLKEECPFCNVKLFYLDRTSNPGYCSKCQNWLGENKENRILEEEQVSGSLEKAILIRDMLTWINQDKNVLLNRETYITSFTWMVNNFFAGDILKAADTLGFSKTTFRSWINGLNRPTIASILDICLYLELSIEALLLKRESRSQTTYKRIYSTGRIKVTKKQIDHRAILGLLSSIIEKGIIISIKKISQIVGCDRKLLSSIYSEQCQMIISHNKVQMKNKKVVRFLDISKKIEEAFFFLIQANEYPSYRKMEDLLGERILQEKELRDRYNELRMLIDKFYNYLT